MNRVKKFITGIIFLMMFTVSLNVFAEDISVTLNGSNIVFEDAKPIIYNDRTLIPIRAVFEKANCYVDWDSKNNMAVIGNEEKVIFISINSESTPINVPADASSNHSFDNAINAIQQPMPISIHIINTIIAKTFILPPIFLNILSLLSILLVQKFTKHKLFFEFY